MHKKAFSLALLLSLSLPVMQLDAMDDLKDLVGSLAGYVIKTGTIAGAVGGTWFILKQLHDIISQRKSSDFKRGHTFRKGTSDSEQGLQALRTLLQEHKNELQTQLTQIQKICSQAVEANKQELKRELENCLQGIETNKEQLTDVFKTYKNDLDALKILVAQQESTILEKANSQYDKVIGELAKRLIVVENYKVIIESLTGRLDAVEKFGGRLNKNEQAIIKGAEHIDGVNQRLELIETQNGKFNERLLVLENPKEIE